MLQNWNITVSNVTSSSISVGWTHYVPDYPNSVYLYAVVCTPILYPSDPVIVTTNKAMTSLDVQRLRILTEYRVQVVALVVHVGSGDRNLTGSRNVLVNTADAGNHVYEPVLRLQSNLLNTDTKERDPSVRILEMFKL